MTMTEHEVGKTITLVASTDEFPITPEETARREQERATFYRGRIAYDPRDTRKAIGRYNPDGTVEAFVPRTFQS